MDIHNKKDQISNRKLKEVFNPSVLFQINLVSYIFDKKYGQYGIRGEMPPQLIEKIERLKYEYSVIESLINEIEDKIILGNISTTEEYIRVNFLKHDAIKGISELEIDIPTKNKNSFIDDVYEVIQHT